MIPNPDEYKANLKERVTKRAIEEADKRNELFAQMLKDAGLTGLSKDSKLQPYKDQNDSVYVRFWGTSDPDLGLRIHLQDSRMTMRDGEVKGRQYLYAVAAKMSKPKKYLGGLITTKPMRIVEAGEVAKPEDLQKLIEWLDSDD